MTEKWNLMREAIDNGDFKAVQDIESKGAYLPSCIEYAAEKGEFEIIKYVGSKHPNCVTIWDDCAVGAAIGGHIDIFKYAESKGASSSAMMDSASQCGAKREIVDYCISKGYVTSDYLQSIKSAHLRGSLFIDSPEPSERPIGIMKSMPNF